MRPEPIKAMLEIFNFRFFGMARVGRIKARIPRIGRIDARGVLVGCQTEAKAQKRKSN